MGFDFDLTVIWAGILAFAVFAYVVMDGFDLGIGILFPLLERGQQRDATMNSVAPVWDGNETWLILGGGGLLAAFPLAYAIIMPAVYVPLIAMLLGTKLWFFGSLLTRARVDNLRRESGKSWLQEGAPLQRDLAARPGARA